jgi:hypothetical protein
VTARGVKVPTVQILPEGDGGFCPRCNGTGVDNKEGNDNPPPDAVIVETTLPTDEGEEVVRINAMREKSAMRSRGWIIGIILLLFTLSMIAAPIAAAFLSDAKPVIEEVGKSREQLIPIVTLIVGFYFGTQSRG